MGMRADQNAVLKALANRDATATALCSHLALSRKSALAALGRLMQKRLIERVNPGNARNLESVDPIYRVTPAGAEIVASGKRITSGPNGPLTGLRKGSQDTFRARLWRALRIQKKATIPQLVEIARAKKDAEDVDSNAFRYLQALTRAGVVAKLPSREKGFAPSSNGFVRWALVRDLGPLAPQAGAKYLVDFNAQDGTGIVPYVAKIQPSERKARR